MSRPVLFGLLPLCVLLAGCGSSAPAPLAMPTAAVPQTASLGWTESTGPGPSRVTFQVRRFAVTRDGWSADLAVTNDTAATFTIENQDQAPNGAFGLMVFTSGAHSELEQRNTKGTLPTVRSATSFSPALPGTLGPHRTWAGTASAPGALPAGLWVRFVFGAFVPDGAMPDSLSSEGVNDVLVWITDHALRLSS